MTNFDRVSAFLQTRDKDKTQNNTSIQIGEFLWSVVEFLESINVSGPQSEDDIATAIKRLKRSGGAMKRGQTMAIIQNENREVALRALCNADVNGNGVAYLAMMEKNGADAATLDAVDALLVDGKPILSPGGKLVRPENWAPADLKGFI